MSSRLRAACALALLGLGAAASPPKPAELAIAIDGLRGARGVIMLCLTQRPKFLDCAKDPARVTRIVPAGQAGAIRIAGLAAGDWSLLVVHDANRNGKLDTVMGMPTEGFGFSRNPHLRMGPPRHDEVRFAIGAAGASQRIKMRYLL